MKFPTLLLLLAPLLALAQNTPSGSWPAAPSGANAPAPGAPICGQGFTYCGYILRDHQSFPESEIVKAYCAGNVANCASGKTKTDPIQGLYVCVPPGPSGPSLSNVSDTVRREEEEVGGVEGAGTTFVTSSGAPTSTAVGDDGACAATAGNRIELLCSCGGQCLNPSVDHIGRCDVPCS